MAEMADPIGHLDFHPKCEWRQRDGAPCPLEAVRAVRWECRCVTLICGVHVIAVLPTTLFACNEHGEHHALRKEPLW